MYLHSNEIQRGSQVHRGLWRVALTVLLFFSFFVAPLHAYTVALFVHHTAENELVRSAIEAGALEELFNAGHIVFNAVPNRLALNTEGNWQWLRSIAYDMGADHLLWIDCNQTILGEQFVLESTYIFIELARPGSLVEDAVSQSENRLLSTFTPKHISYRLGRRVVEEILTSIEKNADIY